MSYISWFHRIYATNAWLELIRCRLDRNYAGSKHYDNHGGAVGQVGGWLRIVDCVFATNSVDAANVSTVNHRGGAVSAASMLACTIENSVFSGNYVLNGTPLGGALYLENVVSGRVARCVFARNGAGANPGDTRVSGGTVLFESSLWHGNRTRGLWVTAGTVTVENCTLATNSTWGVDAAGGTTVVRNCILWRNASGDTNGVATVQYSLASNILAGVDGNLNGDPLFANAATGDYRLAKGSPAINAGLNQSWMSGALDLAGAMRILDRRVDMGAYESPPVPGTVMLVR